jgi:hypothetical protein
MMEWTGRNEMMRSIARVSLLALAGVLAACTTPMFTMPPGPQDYRVGFSEGCDAGYAWAGSPFYQRIDVAEPSRSDEPYISGWQAGFYRCTTSYQRIQRATSVLLGPP